MIRTPKSIKAIAIAVGISSVSLLAQAAHAQELLKLGENDSFFGDYYGADDTLHSEGVYTYESTAEARAVVARITRAVGLRPNFIVLAAGVPNAAAVVRGEDRLILYSNAFMESLTAGGEPDWAALSVLAHEVGHHLQGHTIRSGGSRPQIELEADVFSGFAVGRLGGALAQASAAINQISSPAGSATHPRKADRLEAIATGWKDATLKTGSTSGDVSEGKKAGVSTICEFTSGPLAGTRVDYAPQQPIPVGSFCHDGAGSTGIVVSKESATGQIGGQQDRVAQQYSTICEFTSGPRAGTRVDYAPRQAIPVGSPCHDGVGSTGTVVAAGDVGTQGHSDGQMSTICKFTSGPRRGTRIDYAPQVAIPAGSPCHDGAGSTGTVVPRN